MNGARGMRNGPADPPAGPTSAPLLRGLPRLEASPVAFVLGVPSLPHQPWRGTLGAAKGPVQVTVEDIRDLAVELGVAVPAVVTK